MLFNLLTGTGPKQDPSVGEASLYALLGFAVVFIGIIFLIFVVWLVGQIMAKTQAKPIKTEKVEEKPLQVSPTVKEDELSEETIAVIMAALTAYYQTNNPKCEFTLKRIKRI